MQPGDGVNNPYDKVHELARAIRSSEVFQELKRLRQQIEQDPAALRMLQDFRRQQLAYEAGRLAGQADAQEADRLRKLAEVVMLHQDVRQYLEAEYRWGVFWSDVQRILAETIEEALLPLPTEEGEEKR
ncbi:hypothetical protein GCM10010885_20980 [Alicyclobacillus cellulosilyticus]|uniref:Cell fate (Sporulation/competence/biofilm development) regulator YlbF (YheA/YmcA/DUF963 family) n=1 Tax=Alicyclobacillus cellulosilyticus TaxID=1003997 RepID=A0A917KHC4_9BACL|nr:YlbF family regulator [Alicyclobacillus cellulosilyticus]GGJ11480.1 hypothetical protein GCM10010885_20980 [Alicyclobacillus cellulosilyticus]